MLAVFQLNIMLEDKTNLRPETNRLTVADLAVSVHSCRKNSFQFDQKGSSDYKRVDCDRNHLFNYEQQQSPTLSFSVGKNKHCVKKKPIVCPAIRLEKRAE